MGEKHDDDDGEKKMRKSRGGKIGGQENMPVAQLQGQSSQSWRKCAKGLSPSEPFQVVGTHLEWL